MGDNVVVVGGGIAGLAASAYLARGGKNVTLFEKRSTLGGRAATHRRQGFRFNLGPHALYRRGAAMRVLDELGVPAEGRRPPASGIALLRDTLDVLPTTLWGLLRTGLLTTRAKVEAIAFRRRLRRIPAEIGDVSIGEWLDANVSDAELRRVMEAIVRLATYANYPREQSAAAVLRQLQVASRGVIYVHEGWQRIVNGLHSAAVGAGVNFVTSSRIVGIDHSGGSLQGIELGGFEDLSEPNTRSLRLDEARERSKGTKLRAETVVLAVDPVTASDMIDGAPAEWRMLKPITLATLDVGLSALPDPRKRFALGIDEPLYFSVHSATAHLAPKDGALIHVSRYLDHVVGASVDVPEEEENRGETSVEAELERVLDRLQPGWRERVVHRRFFPNMTVSNALVRAGTGGAPARPGIAVPGIMNLYVAGDWVGPEGMLADAALSSARAAAQAVLGS
jgi:phytoene dehydrogenase-like protein